MIFKETKLKGAYIIDVNRIVDERGFFGRSYCKKEFEAQGLNAEVLQTNVSYNHKKGTLRGMHMQTPPFGESKTVRCTKGSIYDVIVDMRPESLTFRHWIGVELTEWNYKMLYVPEGFAHGFLTLEDDTHVTYQVSQVYTPGAEQCYRWDDPTLGIEWPFQPQLISAKDSAHASIEIAPLLKF